MKIVLESETALRVEGGDGIVIEAVDDALAFSPFHMVAAGLGACTFSLLYTWAQHARLDAAALAIGVAWSFADGGARVEQYRVRVDWPALPAERHAAARNAAEQCAVGGTLEHGAAVDVAVE